MVEAVKMRKRRHWRKDTIGDRIYYIFTWFILILLAAIVIYPLYFIVIASISNPDAIFNGEVYFYPLKITFDGYKRLFDEPLIWSGYLNTIIYTVFGTAFNLLLTIPAGWALSRKNLPFRRVITWFMVITMFFGGGLIPYYLLVAKLNLVDNPLSMIILGGVSVWNVFVVKSYFTENIPSELLEAAQIDGCGEFRSFWHVVLPLAKPIIAVMVLFYAVGHWNSYFDALIFLSDEKYFPLQLVLRDILITAEVTSQSGGSAETIIEQAKIANQIKYSSIIVSSIPILVFYPLVQKFFKAGFLVGSFK
jgi:putative aldouronate transport system permease protein